MATFTVPEGLRRTIRSHPRELLGLLFRTAAATLLEVCANPRWFGATPGVTGVLHTWTRQLEYHPHIHFLATDGGLDPQGHWREPARKFLVPVHALSKVFRARFRDTLEARHPDWFAALPEALWQKPWVVHCKPVGSGEPALRYLSRYLFRVALSNAALLRADDTAVTFRYRDSTDRRARTCTLAPLEFLRRFLQHVLPKGLVKVRYFGLHHPSKREALSLARLALYLRAGREPPPPKPPEEPAPPPCRCPRCAATMHPVEVLQPQPMLNPLARGPPGS